MDTEDGGYNSTSSDEDEESLNENTYAEFIRALPHTQIITNQAEPFPDTNNENESIRVLEVIEYIIKEKRFKTVGHFIQAFTTSQHAKVKQMRGCFHESRTQLLSSRIMVTWSKQLKSCSRTVLQYFENVIGNNIRREVCKASSDDTLSISEFSFTRKAVTLWSLQESLMQASRTMPCLARLLTNATDNAMTGCKMALLVFSIATTKKISLLKLHLSFIAKGCKVSKQYQNILRFWGLGVGNTFLITIVRRLAQDTALSIKDVNQSQYIKFQMLTSHSSVLVLLHSCMITCSNIILSGTITSIWQ